MKQRNFSRRDFLKLSGVAAGSLFLAPALEEADMLTTRAQSSKPRLRDLAASLDMEVGVSLRTIDRWMFYQYPKYLNAIKQFSMIKDGYTSSPDNWMNDLNCYEYLVQLGRFAKKNQMGLSLDQLFDWSWFQPPHLSAYLQNGTQEQLDDFLQDMVRKHLEVPYFTDLTFASEPTGSDQDDVPYWNSSPLLRYYGEDWPEMAYHLAWDEARRTGRSVGENLTFVYAAAGQIEVPNSRHAEYEYKHLSELRQRLSDSLGIERPFAIGMEYHIHHGPIANPLNGCWGPAAQKLKKPELIEHFRRFNEIGDMMINECSIAGTEDPEQKKETLHILLEAAIESGAVRRVLFWSPFLQPGEEPGEYDRTCDHLNLFKEDFTPDYMFNEMYKIFENYQGWGDPERGFPESAHSLPHSSSVPALPI